MNVIRRLQLISIITLLTAVLSGCLPWQRQARNEIPRPNIPENRTEAEEFNLLPDGTVEYPGALQGVDVSSHQGEIDWKKVKNAGIDFAILQIGYRGYSVGKLNPDDRFVENYNAASEAGIRLGVYFYSQAVSEDEALEEADYVLELLKDRALELPVFFDWEEVTEGRTRGFATSSVGDFALSFCRRITAGGYQAGVYFNQKYGYTIMHLESLADYTYWLAEYRNYQSFGYAVGIWQYTGSGRVDGIELPVDRDLMYPAGE